MSSSSKPPLRNVPPPPGSRSTAHVYQRFIPREELGDFESWRPGELDDDGAAAAAAAPAAGARNATPGAAGSAPRTAGMPGGSGAGFAAGMPGGPGSRAAAPAAPPEPDTAEWQRRVHAARQQGYQDGYRDGLAALEGFKQSFAQEATRQVGALLEAFDAQTQALDAELSRTVAETAVALARQVLRSELRTNPALVAQVAAEAVDAVLLSARHITVSVHPLDLPLVAEGAEEALSARGARLLADRAIERGGVRVDSEVGTVDARIGERWRLAAEGLGSAQRWEGEDAA